MAAKKKNLEKGAKFTERYGVETATIYKGDTDALRIPPPGHPLHDPTSPSTFDPFRVAEIDRDGKMTDPIEVWTDPDTGILWSIDGRGRIHDVREVNRRRAKEGRELVKPYIVPFNGDEKHAIARVRVKNYHRRIPTKSGTALDLLVLRRAGWSWGDCAAKLHHQTDNPEHWGRSLLPLAHCIQEVREAIDSGELPAGAAARFGGTDPDGEKALSRSEQLALLRQLREEREKRAESKPAPGVGRAAQARALHALQNGATSKLDKEGKLAAKLVAATLARLAGDADALSEWPEVREILEAALKPLPKGPRPKAQDQEA